MDFIFGILGIIGGMFTATGDILLDLKGKGNQKSGPMGLVDSKWLTMAEWRFPASILAAAIGVPLYLAGLIGMSHQLSLGSPLLGTLFFAFSLFGASGGLFIHGLLCCFPIIRKTLAKHGVEDAAQYDVMEKIFGAIKIPFIAMWVSLVVATSVILIVAIIGGTLNVPYVFIVANPLGLTLVGFLFRAINKDVFADLPGIIMPSLGLSMIGLMTALSAWA